MKKAASKVTKSKAPAATVTADEEPRNVAVTVLANRTKIGSAVCSAGRCDFPLTGAEAKALAELGLVRIDGIF